MKEVTVHTKWDESRRAYSVLVSSADGKYVYGAFVEEKAMAEGQIDVVIQHGITAIRRKRAQDRNWFTRSKARLWYAVRNSYYRVRARYYRWKYLQEYDCDGS